MSRYTCHKMCYSRVSTGQLITTSLLMTGLGPVIDITNVTLTPLHNKTVEHKWDFRKSSGFCHPIFRTKERDGTEACVMMFALVSCCAGQSSPFSRHVSPRSEEITNWFVIDQYSDDILMIRIMEAIRSVLMLLLLSCGGFTIIIIFNGKMR